MCCNCRFGGQGVAAQFSWDSVFSKKDDCLAPCAIALRHSKGGSSMGQLKYWPMLPHLGIPKGPWGKWPHNFLAESFGGNIRAGIFLHLLAPKFLRHIGCSVQEYSHRSNYLDLTRASPSLIL